MRQRLVGRGLLVLALGVMSTAGLGVAGAQEPGGGEGFGGPGGMGRVSGMVTAVSGDAVTVKSEDGTVYQVTTTVNTRVMKGVAGDRQPAALKVSELKVGDGVMAAGNMDAPKKTLHAMFVVATDAEQVKKLRENLGKTYIQGKVTAIDADNLKMTVLRGDGASQTIGLDETTSFKRGARRMRGGESGGAGGGAGLGAGAGSGWGGGPGAEGGESITLADVKVGDNVVGTGSLKAGVFVPGQLMVMAPRPPRAAGAAGRSGSPQSGSPQTGPPQSGPPQ